MRNTFGRGGSIWGSLMGAEETDERDEPRQPARKRGREWRFVLLILVGLFLAWHVVPALSSRDNPPASCQILGGHWNPWSGWSCD
jgi:hypothetical protein